VDKEKEKEKDKNVERWTGNRTSRQTRNQEVTRRGKKTW